MWRLYHRLFIPCFLIFLVVIAGSLGYMWIEGEDFLSALFMMVITFSTVGYSSHIELSPVGEWYTIFLILFSIVILYVSLSLLPRGYLKKKVDNLAVRSRYKWYKKRVVKMKSHVIVVGAGELGISVVKKLLGQGRQVLLVDPSREKVGIDHKNFFFLKGSIADDSVLKEVQMEEATHFISTMANDAEGLMMVISVRQVNSKIKILSRVINPGNAEKFLFAGSDEVILSDNLEADYIASCSVSPVASKFVRWLGANSLADCFWVLPVKDKMTKLAGQKLRDIELIQKTGCKVMGIQKPDQSYSVAPSGETVVDLLDQLILFGGQDQVDQLKTYL